MASNDVRQEVKSLTTHLEVVDAATTITKVLAHLDGLTATLHSSKRAPSDPFNVTIRGKLHTVRCGSLIDLDSGYVGFELVDTDSRKVVGKIVVTSHVVAIDPDSIDPTHPFTD